MSWTDERVAMLTKLWADGLSASQIAGVLGGVTRNAVIGKVHRLGLSGRAKSPSTASNRAKRTPRASSPNRSGASAAKKASGTGVNGTAVSASLQPKPIQDLVAPEPKKLALVELSETTCKWPIGDPATEDFYFCGNKGKEGGPYCEYHAQLAFQPNTDRRREKRTGTR